ncbi:MAG: hypothetical protein MHM6MM_003777 [Cercozoa sp. M6MM]
MLEVLSSVSTSETVLRGESQVFVVRMRKHLKRVEQEIDNLACEIEDMLRQEMEEELNTDSSSEDGSSTDTDSSSNSDSDESPQDSSTTEEEHDTDETSTDRNGLEYEATAIGESHQRPIFRTPRQAQAQLHARRQRFRESYDVEEPLRPSLHRIRQEHTRESAMEVSSQTDSEPRLDEVTDEEEDAFEFMARFERANQRQVAEWSKAPRAGAYRYQRHDFRPQQEAPQPPLQQVSSNHQDREPISSTSDSDDEDSDSEEIGENFPFEAFEYDSENNYYCA